MSGEEWQDAGTIVSARRIERGYVEPVAHGWQFPTTPGIQQLYRATSEEELE